jgi:phosphatidylethanolamine-binding protein (PEBP) family uncharacterized protein
MHGRNSLGNLGYDGPLGTLGRTIRYRFRLFALDMALASILASTSRPFSRRSKATCSKRASCR